MSVTTFTTVNGMILSQAKGGVVSHFVPDPLGSVVMVRDTSGNTVYEAEYDPYGNVQSETGTNPSSLGYVGTLGYIKDSATSMYVRARYLLSNLGRWLTKDPLWPQEPGYVYAGATPSMRVDPSGQMSPISLISPFIDPMDVPGFKEPCPEADPINCLICAAPVPGPVVREADRWCRENTAHQGPSDGTICNAYQHCLWTCAMSRRCSPSCAWFVGVAHETDGPTPPFRTNPGVNPPSHRCMDMFNNRIGLLVAAGSKSCTSGCEDQIRKGNCAIVKPIIHIGPVTGNFRQEKPCRIGCMVQ